MLTPLQQTTARIAAVVRVGSLVVGAPMALFSAIPPVALGSVVVALVGWGVWVVIFARVALRRGLTSPLVAVDLALTVLLCLLSGWLVPLHRIDESSSWTAAIACFCVVTIPMAWPARAAIPAGLLVAAAFYASFPLVGLPGRGADNTAILIFQLLSVVVVMAVVRRAGAAADTAVTAANAARSAALVAEARRQDESTQLRLLHDTALTTLTLVGTGSVATSATLADRAAADTAAIERIAVARPAAADGSVRLDELLAAAVREAPRSLAVDDALEPCLAPAPVAEALVGAVGEALRNVDRHAGVTAVTLRLSNGDGGICVEIRDRGRGFDPTTAPAHRYGVRQSIIGRLAAVGGVARVESAPGSGTRWALQWSSGEPA